MNMAAGLLSLFPDYTTESHQRKDGIAGFSVKTKVNSVSNLSVGDVFEGDGGSK